MGADGTAPEEARSRAADLIRHEKAGGLASEEASELEHYQQLEHLMRLAKARAAGPAPDGPLNASGDGTERERSVGASPVWLPTAADAPPRVVQTFCA